MGETNGIVLGRFPCGGHSWCLLPFIKHPWERRARADVILRSFCFLSDMGSFERPSFLYLWDHLFFELKTVLMAEWHIPVPCSAMGSC